MPLANAHHSARTQALARQATAIPSHLRSLHDATPWRDACIPVTAPTRSVAKPHRPECTK
jgi:hypothetical protein